MSLVRRERDVQPKRNPYDRELTVLGSHGRFPLGDGAASEAALHRQNAQPTHPMLEGKSKPAPYAPESEAEGLWECGHLGRPRTRLYALRSLELEKRLSQEARTITKGAGVGSIQGLFAKKSPKRVKQSHHVT